MKLKELLAQLVEIDTWDEDLTVMKDGCCGAVCGEVTTVRYSKRNKAIYLLSDKDAIGAELDPWERQVNASPT